MCCDVFVSLAMWIILYSFIIDIIISWFINCLFTDLFILDITWICRSFFLENRKIAVRLSRLNIPAVAEEGKKLCCYVFVSLAMWIILYSFIIDIIISWFINCLFTDLFILDITWICRSFFLENRKIAVRLSRLNIPAVAEEGKKLFCTQWQMRRWF